MTIYCMLLSTPPYHVFITKDVFHLQRGDPRKRGSFPTHTCAWAQSTISYTVTLFYAKKGKDIRFEFEGSAGPHIMAPSAPPVTQPRKDARRGYPGWQERGQRRGQARRRIARRLPERGIPQSASGRKCRIRP